MNGPANMVMNAAAGGPVGGAAMKTAQFAAQQLPESTNYHDLNTYIYDHLLKTKQYPLAREFLKANQCKTKDSKSRLNGVQMDTDSKDPKIPEDLPEPDIMPCPGDGSFLAEWWTSFWDIFIAAHNRPNAPAHAREYVKHQRMVGGHAAMQQFRMGQFGMMPGTPAGLNGLMAAKQFQQQRNALQMQQHQQKMMSGAQMQRAPSMDIDQREQTPIENAPSPSKRPRIDNGPGFDGPGMVPGRPGVNPQMANMPGGPGQLMLQNGMREINPQQMAAFAANGQKIEGMNGIQNMGQQMDGMEYTNGQPIPSDPSDNRHALQDYQMQLMLLEQQNKKRLLQARRDQDHILIQTGNPAQVPFAPNMSPSGSRGGGPSPGPNDQMKRVAAGTPKMAQQGMPGSPMTDMQNRASPTPNFDPSGAQISQGMSQQYYQNLGAGGLARPPSSHPNFQMQMPGQVTPAQMDQMRRNISNGVIMPNGQQWQQAGPHGPVVPNASQPGPAAMAAVVRPGNMGPPPAPATDAPAAAGPPQRPQPSPPAQSAAPPTPQPATKGGTKKKEGGGNKKKAGNKKGAAAAATPSNDATEQPPTPAAAPSTPITPMPAAMMTKAAAAAAQQQPPGPNALPQGQPQPGPAPIGQGGMPDGSGGFGGMTGDHESGFSLEFTGIDTADVLDSFDFDQFVNNDDNAGLNFGDLVFNDNGVEAGAGNI